MPIMQRYGEDYPAGVVSTVSSLYQIRISFTGIAFNSAGGYYVANDTQSSIQQVSSAGAISTLVRSLVNYHKGCGYDPVGLGTANNVVLCRYGLAQGDILLTVTQTGANTYSLQTQALTSAPYTGGPYNQITSGYAVAPSIPALASTFTWTTSATGAQARRCQVPTMSMRLAVKLQDPLV